MQGLATNKTLVTLELRSNSIDDAGAAAIVQRLATNTTLMTLDPRGNRIGAAGAAAINKYWLQTKRWWHPKECE